MPFNDLQKLISQILDDMKAFDITVLDVRKLTSITDLMFICTGNSSRHVVSIAQKVAEKAKESGIRPLSVAGTEDAEWVLVDLGDAIVHVMQAKTREFYQLEKLWDIADK
jgi:ribosome-associated protein